MYLAKNTSHGGSVERSEAASGVQAFLKKKANAFFLNKKQRDNINLSLCSEKLHKPRCAELKITYGCPALQ